MARDATRLDGKVAIVTGGAGGIGEATTRLLIERGARVVVADIAFERAEALAKELAQAIPLYVDLGDEASIGRMIDQTLERFGRLDILHNNAALLDPDVSEFDTDAESMDVNVWDRTFKINVRGTMLACRAALPHLRESRGSIVNMTSTLALEGHVFSTAYSASKAAIIQMTRSIAASHAPYGIRCNAVAPGMTMTPGLRSAFPPALIEATLGETLRDQLGDPEDIAEAVAFLASDAARNITGHVLVCDGGHTSHVAGLAPLRNLFSVKH